MAAKVIMIMTVFAAVVLLISSASAQGAAGDTDCVALPLFFIKDCRTVTVPIEEGGDGKPVFSDARACCAAFAQNEECVCDFRRQLVRQTGGVADPKKIFCPATEGCPDA